MQDLFWNIQNSHFSLWLYWFHPVRPWRRMHPGLDCCQAGDLGKARDPPLRNLPWGFQRPHVDREKEAELEIPDREGSIHEQEGFLWGYLPFRDAHHLHLRGLAVNTLHGFLTPHAHISTGRKQTPAAITAVHLHQHTSRNLWNIQFFQLPEDQGDLGAGVHGQRGGSCLTAQNHPEGLTNIFMTIYITALSILMETVSLKGINILNLLYTDSHRWSYSASIAHFLLRKGTLFALPQMHTFILN